MVASLAFLRLNESGKQFTGISSICLSALVGYIEPNMKITKSGWPHGQELQSSLNLNMDDTRLFEIKISTFTNRIEREKKPPTVETHLIVSIISSEHHAVML